MALSDQYPALYQAWATAGGIEDNFRAHILALAGDGVTPTAEDLVFMVQHAAGALSQLQAALAKYGVRTGFKQQVVVVSQPG